MAAGDLVIQGARALATLIILLAKLIENSLILAPEGLIHCSLAEAWISFKNQF